MIYNRQYNYYAQLHYIAKWINYWIHSTVVDLMSSTYHKTKEEVSKELVQIKKAQEDPKYFASLYIRYHDELFLFINKRVDNLDITADLTSRVFLQCLKNLKKFKYQGVPFSSWLYRIAINEVNQFFRKESKFTRSVSLDDNHINTLIHEIDYSQTLIDSHVLVSVLLEQLTEHEIQFIELRFFENRSFKDMGYLLGLTEVNAKIKTYRILKKLKKLSENINYSDND